MGVDKRTFGIEDGGYLIIGSMDDALELFVRGGQDDVASVPHVAQNRPVRVIIWVPALIPINQPLSPCKFDMVYFSQT